MWAEVLACPTAGAQKAGAQKTGSRLPPEQIGGANVTPRGYFNQDEGRAGSC